MIGFMKRTVVWLTKPQVRALTRMSAKSLAPVSALVRLAVRDFLHNKQKLPTPRGAKRKSHAR